MPSSRTPEKTSATQASHQGAARLSRGQKLFALGVLLVNLVVWAIPSNVVELVARDRQTLLGRYSREHFAWILALIPFSVAAIHIHFAASAAQKKARLFRVVALVLAVFIPLLGFDLYLRVTKHWGYVLGTLAYHRTPNDHLEGAFNDVPLAHRTYPHVAPGYGKVAWHYTTDARGYRNPPDPARRSYDVVVLGDSFAEGSEVDDGQCWPVLLHELTGVSVYNLGVSGYAPQHYRAALRDYGLELSPKWVLCLLYEGNDFHSAKLNPRVPSVTDHLFKRSPLIHALDQWLIATLGPIGARRDLPELDLLSWLPVAVPAGDRNTYYAFSPNDLLRLRVTPASFRENRRWRSTAQILKGIAADCRQANIRFALAYAPVKPHVVLPLVRDALPVEKFHDFVALRAKEKLPPPEEFVRVFFDNLDVKERAVRDWCERESVPFVSLTAPLRAAIKNGTQTYYTYNEHWSPAGHKVAADAIAAFFKREPATAGSPVKPQTSNTVPASDP